MHYKKDDPRFQWRLDYFKKEVLPRILNQSDPNFDIWIRCYPWQKKILESLSPRIKTFTVKNEGARYKQHKRNPKKQYFHDFVKWEDVENLPRYEIQMSLDSDDLIDPLYVAFLRITLDQLSKTNPGKRIHACFQPESLDLKTGETKKLGNYTSKRGSAFFGFYQPISDDYFFIGSESHISMWKHADLSVVLPIGSCWATVHDINESTGK
jgi:hypothetical protein